MSKGIHVGSLAPEELVLLDGQCSPEVQEKVDNAKLRLAYESDLIGDAVSEARRMKKLTFRHTNINHCPLCGRAAGYAPYKSGPRKGEPNYNRPRTIGAYELADRFVAIRGHVRVGGCKACVESLLPALRDALTNEHCELPEALRKEGATRYKRVRIMSCQECGWIGPESDMGRLNAVMSGTYPAKCPECDAANVFLGPLRIKSTDEYTLLQEDH